VCTRGARDDGPLQNERDEITLKLSISDVTLALVGHEERPPDILLFAQVTRLRYVLVATLALAGTACGGGGPTTMPTPPPPFPPAGLSCGVERWFVKTLADRDAARVNVEAVTPTSIRDLNNLPVRCSGLPETRSFDEEFEVFEVTGRITFVAHEDDRDYHIALEDVSNPGYTMVSELADTLCAGAIVSPHFSTLSRADAMWRTLLGDRSPQSVVGTVVRVRGVGFYDFAHGQRGRSRNCMELHPILSIDRP
jgi:hypothetical protein